MTVMKVVIITIEMCFLLFNLQLWNNIIIKAYFWIVMTDTKTVNCIY